MRCIDADRNCRGPVDFWHSGGMMGKAWPRCTYHGEKRLERYDAPDSLELWADSDVAPPWFDPTLAGERWTDDY